MSLLTVTLADIIAIDCGEYGVFKKSPRYKPFLLQRDSFLLGKHELRLSKREIFKRFFSGSEAFLDKKSKEREKFIREILGPILDPRKRDELLKQVLDIDIMNKGDEREIVLPIVRENFNEVKFSDIIELKLRRRFLWWSFEKIIDVTYQGGSVSFHVCDLNIFFGLPHLYIETQNVFESVQKGMNTFRRS